MEFLKHRAAAHFWTIWPLVKAKLEPPPIPPDEPFAVIVDDPDVGSVEINGRLHPRPGAPLVVLVHGLGGCVDSRYMRSAARIGWEMGFAILRLNQRGSDRGGADLYHAGLTGDLAAALASPRLAGVERVGLLGFSLGGHVVLKLAGEFGRAREVIPKVQAVAAVCAPLDLSATVDAFDRWTTWLYRRYILLHLSEIYEAIAARPEVPRHLLRASLDDVRGARKLRDWDRLTVVPRFGFRDVEDYYATASVGPHLGALAIPTLLIATEGDPMVDRGGIRPALERVDHDLEVRWLRRGGHVGFPADLDLGYGQRLGLEGQVFGWLARHLDTARGLRKT